MGLSSGFDSAKVSSGCGGASELLYRVAISLSLTVYVAVQKKAADSMYPIAIERWNPTSCSLSAVSFGIRKATEGMSSVRTHMRIKASARSTLQM